ncbi:hypothetical protein Taro_020905 [Colocasia esculenta]|uniref:Uncharacterized protein n=1 Tax=Colocasia esculenta TaxID=4460 RepID=A0A843V3G2_COLES|nr:hypothetical protein [Colocasia esculenta]
MLQFYRLFITSVLRSRLVVSTELVTSEAHPYSPQERARRRFLYRRPVRSRGVAEVVMADRRDWGGGGDDPHALSWGTDTSCRHWSPTSPFLVPHSSKPRPGSLEVPGMGLRPCGPQVCSVLGEFPTEPVTSEAHPYSPHARARRRFLYCRPVQSHGVALAM